jgi:hypothetical protein
MLRQTCHFGMTEGATENVTPIHSALATEVSTDAVAVPPTTTAVALAAVATAPPLSQSPEP